MSLGISTSRGGPGTSSDPPTVVVAGRVGRPGFRHCSLWSEQKLGPGAPCGKGCDSPILSTRGSDVAGFQWRELRAQDVRRTCPLWNGHMSPGRRCPLPGAGLAATPPPKAAGSGPSFSLPLRPPPSGGCGWPRLPQRARGGVGPPTSLGRPDLLWARGPARHARLRKASGHAARPRPRKRWHSAVPVGPPPTHGD